MNVCRNVPTGIGYMKKSAHGLFLKDYQFPCTVEFVHTLALNESSRLWHGALLFVVDELAYASCNTDGYSYAGEPNAWPESTGHKSGIVNNIDWNWSWSAQASRQKSVSRYQRIAERILPKRPQHLLQSISFTFPVASIEEVSFFRLVLASSHAIT